MSNTTSELEVTPLDEPLVYRDSGDIPEEHQDKVQEAVQAVDSQVLQFKAHADSCYAAKSIEALEEALEKLELEVRKEFFYGLAATPPAGLPIESALWELATLAQSDPKSAARWCAKLDPEYGTAYALGWVQKQQALLQLGLPNDAAALVGERALAGEAAPKQLTAEPETQGLRTRVVDTAKKITSRWLKRIRKEKHHG